MDNISFTSRIKLVSNENFARLILKGTKSVDFPWTISESVLGKSALTKDIYDCTSAGIVADGEVLLMHLSPNGGNYKTLNKVEKFITQKINLFSQNIQGFLIGSKKNNINSPNSTKLFDKFEKLLNKHNIPYSKFKGGNYNNNIAYLGDTDTWLISNDVVDLTKSVYRNDKKQVTKFMFDDVKISDNDILEV